MDTSLGGNTGTTLGVRTSPESESEVAQSCPTLWDPHGLWPARLLRPWDFPGKNTGVGCHFLLQGLFLPQGSNSDLPQCGQILYCLSHQGSPSHPLNLPESFCCPWTLRPSPPALKGPSIRLNCLATNLLFATDVIPHSVMGQKPHGLSFVVVAIRERRGKKILN